MIDLNRKAPKGRDFVFRTKDGREVGRASTLGQFRDILRGIDEDCLLNHVNAGRNDFAAWLEGAFDDRDLADLPDVTGTGQTAQVLDLRASTEVGVGRVRTGSCHGTFVSRW